MKDDSIAAWVLAQLAQPNPEPAAAQLELPAAVSFADEFAPAKPSKNATKRPGSPPAAGREVRVPRERWARAHDALTRHGINFNATTTMDSRTVIVHTSDRGLSVLSGFASAEGGE